VNNNWSDLTDWETVCKRNSGRRRYNARRSLLRTLRQDQVLKLLARYGLSRRGVYSRIARELGVHRSVITRDVQFLLTESLR
jgi:hypothetical protein